MSLKRLLGLCLFLSPFVVITVMMYFNGGWGMVLKVWSLVILTVFVIFSGLYLMDKED